jgi:uncharacterized protein YneF (UPF0154 family)
MQTKWYKSTAARVVAIVVSIFVALYIGMYSFLSIVLLNFGDPPPIDEDIFVALCLFAIAVSIMFPLGVTRLLFPQAKKAIWYVALALAIIIALGYLSLGIY